MDPQKVVAALLVEGDRVLVSKRLVDDHFPGLWEFPGGKVEAGESLAEALIRELKEELDLDIEVGRLFDQLEFP
ncbi:MAG: NUDIX domain-containing protein, partial [Candidatus Eisenbacteria bacterium]|nr:NUDIX domain-containing protein [Candidatus Eisenbacteria bacterium]